jgi:hypothetical protein
MQFIMRTLPLLPVSPEWFSAMIRIIVKTFQPFGLLSCKADGVLDANRLVSPDARNTEWSNLEDSELV